MKNTPRTRASLLLALVALAASHSASALNIALTNDDGWSTYGIHALYNALTARGHTVTLAAPLSGESGSSAALDIDAILGSQLLITRRADAIYSVGTPGGSAEPATAGAIAASIAGQTGTPPDLLISGINDGANLGPAAQISGTVGATIVAIGRVIGQSVPAVAISTDDRCEFEEPADPADAVIPDPADIPAECAEVAEFVADMVDELETLPGYRGGKQGLLPPGVALNVNYPPGPVSGARLAVQGRLPLLGGSRISLEVACYACAFIPVGATSPGGIFGITPVTDDDVKQADTDLFAQGYITVVPIEADYTADRNASKGFEGEIQQFLKRH